MQKKSNLEKMADDILREDARQRGYLKGQSLRGYGDYASEYGILTSKRQSEIEKTEKIGFSEEQLESILHGGVDRQTSAKYRKASEE
jgi:hypothetical protein